MNRNRYRRVVLTSAGGATPFDVDALAFIAAEEAAGATFTAEQKTAINNLFLDFKGQGPNNSTTDFWTTNKLKRYWPLVGASAAPNAIDVRLNVGTWVGGWTHASTGAKGNATNTAFYSGLAYNGEATYDWGTGYYGDEYTVGDWMFGILDYSLPGAWWLRQITGPATEFYNQGRGGTANAPVLTGGLNFNGSRIAIGIGNDIHLRYNGILSSFIGLGSPAGDTAVQMVFGNTIDNFGALYGANDIDYRSMFITYGVSVAETLTLSVIDNAFQTALGRNTY